MLTTSWHGARSTVTVATAQPYMLPIYNEYGEKVDEMRFASKEEADRFTNDLQQNNRNTGPNGGAVLTNTPAPAPAARFGRRPGFDRADRLARHPGLQRGHRFGRP